LNWDDLEPLSARCADHAGAINAYVARGTRKGWEDASVAPRDPRREIAPQVLEVVRAANAANEVEELRHRFPPACEPLMDLLPKHGTGIGPLLLLDDDSILVAVAGRGVLLVDDRGATVLSGVLSVGRSPDRRFFARAHSGGVDILDRWDGVVLRTLPWPTGSEGLPAGLTAAQPAGAPSVSALIPFPDGRRALLVSDSGIFVLAEGGATRIHPDRESQEESIAWSRQHYPDNPVSLSLTMAHGAISPDGQLIAVGSQDGNHRILNGDLCEVGRVAPLVSYPHHAVFSVDGSQIAFNSCHFYAGETVGVPTALLPGLDATGEGFDERLTVIDDSCRVYAAVVRGDEYILGDAHGYLRARSTAGVPTWQHFLGSTISGMDISEDGRKLAVGTYGGMLHLLDLDTDHIDPFAIGTATHRERCRWLFWHDEPDVLRW